jgi:hypothetical protein
MTIDTNELRQASVLLGELAAREPSNTDHANLRAAKRALFDAADTIDRLNDAIASAPHSTLCAYMVNHFGEACSCWKADPSPATDTDMPPTPTTTLDDALASVRSLTIEGPHGLVLGLPRVGGAQLVFTDTALTVRYHRPET